MPACRADTLHTGRHRIGGGIAVHDREPVVMQSGVFLGKPWVKEVVRERSVAMRYSVFDTAAPRDFRAVAEVAHPQVLPHPTLLVYLHRVVNVAVEIHDFVQAAQKTTVHDGVCLRCQGIHDLLLIQHLVLEIIQP